MEGDFLHELAQGVSYLGNPVYWFAVIAAVLIAGITGMIPGASGILIMALSIPFIVQYFYGEQRAIGLVMLATMTGVNNTLDSIPAVLLGQPGAATQVTFLEGHQLARQGKAAHTLGAIYAVSAFGGLVGAVVLAMLVPVIKPFILGFGFAEIAAMAFFGIAMVSALSAGAMVKGLAAGAFGVLLGTVGPAVVGEVRFVFQQPILWDRLPIIAVTLGFFALPEMIDLSIARRPVAPSSSVITNKEVWRGARDGMKRWKVMIRQSIFGVLMGAIPGVGAAVIDWLSYAFGIFWSKDKSQFGKGSLDGVLFAESAQNSKEAGQAIPTLALGVPGGLAWLFVLVAMISLDLTPGPRMLGAEADVVILLVVTLAIGNFMIAMLGLVATGQLAKLTRIPYPLIGGVIIPISFLTGIITMTSWLALPIMLVFIGIGVIMKIYQWPRPPLLLGIILGPIIERNFLSALNLHGPVGVATRPITIAVIVLAIATAYVFARSAQETKSCRCCGTHDCRGVRYGVPDQPPACGHGLQERTCPFGGRGFPGIHRGKPGLPGVGDLASPSDYGNCGHNPGVDSALLPSARTRAQACRDYGSRHAQPRSSGCEAGGSADRNGVPAPYPAGWHCGIALGGDSVRRLSAILSHGQQQYGRSTSVSDWGCHGRRAGWLLDWGRIRLDYRGYAPTLDGRVCHGLGRWNHHRGWRRRCSCTGLQSERSRGREGYLPWPCCHSGAHSLGRGADANDVRLVGIYTSLGLQNRAQLVPDAAPLPAPCACISTAA